jgi:starvation-inducible DNA-binding protein
MATSQPLQPTLFRLIADLYTTYLEAHAAHWNVEGPLFPMLHQFFGDYAADVYGSIDTFAEALRQHQFQAPASFVELLHAGELAPGKATGQAPRLLKSLQQKNLALMDQLKMLSLAAVQVDDQGLQNFTQERLAAHLKWDWQFRMQLGA